MHVFRIANQMHIHDLSGEGARIYGGRWNRKGTNVLYTAESRSLAMLEFLVHLPQTIVPKNFLIAKISIPDNLNVKQVDIKNLPDGWSNYPAPLALSQIGEQWIRDNQTLLLKVPSSIVKNEWNILINPKHKQFNKIKLIDTEPVLFDSRLLK